MQEITVTSGSVAGAGGQRWPPATRPALNNPFPICRRYLIFTFR